MQLSSTLARTQEELIHRSIKMAQWTKWMDIEDVASMSGENDGFGIYQIRVVNKNGEVISINRLAGVDSLGILYVGRSGVRLSFTLFLLLAVKKRARSARSLTGALARLFRER